jgi:hypothetical protein
MSPKLFYRNLSSVATGVFIQSEGSLFPDNLHVWRHSSDAPRVINKLSPIHPFDIIEDNLSTKSSLLSVLEQN